jgi:hypothetical protein
MALHSVNGQDGGRSAGFTYFSLSASSSAAFCLSSFFLQRVFGAVESVERLSHHFLYGFPALTDGLVFVVTTHNP